MCFYYDTGGLSIMGYTFIFKFDTPIYGSLGLHDAKFQVVSIEFVLVMCSAMSNRILTIRSLLSQLVNDPMIH